MCVSLRDRDVLLRADTTSSCSLGYSWNLPVRYIVLWHAAQATGSPSCCWPASSLRLSALVWFLLLTRPSRLPGSVSASVAYSVVIPSLALFCYRVVAT